MKTSYYRYASYIFAFTGILFSLLNIFDTSELLCLTSSCEVFSEFTLFGISLWIYSASFFVLLFGLLCIKKYIFVFVFCALGLIADTLLLALMLVTAPCFSCLVIALILALLTMASYKVCFSNKFIYAFIAIWGLLFVINSGALVKESVKPYAIYVNEAHLENPLEASMRVYFSPSCSACNDLVLLLGSREITNANDIVWLPVAESSDDVAKVAKMHASIQAGDDLKTALEKARASEEQDAFITDFLLQARLLINQSRLHAAGTSKIPFIEYTGVPAFLMKKQEIPLESKALSSPNPFPNPLEALGNMSNSKANSSKSIVDEMLNFGVEAYCDDKNTTEPCE